MIDCYTWKTSNGRKATIMLEEIQIPYRLHPIDISKDQQFAPDYIKINPNSKIPTIIDQDGPGGKPFRVIESGAILMYLAEKTGKLMPTSGLGRYRVLEWLMFQMASVGPMLGQTHHFRSYAPEEIPYAIDRYTNEAKRIYGVLDRRLGESEWVAGPEYTIADIATWPWLRSPAGQGVEIDEFPHVKRWKAAVEARPAVQRGVLVPLRDRDATMDDKAKEFLFGKAQYARR